MFQTIKNYFVAKSRSKGWLIFIFLCFIIGAFFPRGASAGLVTSIVSGLFSAIIGAVLSIIMAVTGALVTVAAALLLWVTGPYFINVGFTNNSLVSNGWMIVRDFTNMFIVLGFVVIGVATALGFKEYEAKKTLPLLIGVALLINFSRVFCGLIIDASNMIMNYFLTGGGQLSLGYVTLVWKQLQNYWAYIFKRDVFTNIAIGASIPLFNLFAFVILLLFAILFAIRYVVLWILVILSPLAFFCYVFDFTKKFWTMWWNNFIQWCIIGIPAAFFLYLSERTLSLQMTTAPQSGGAGDLLGMVIGAISAFAMYFVPLLMLIAGFLFTLQTSAIGASVITNQAAKLKKLPGWAKGKALTAMKESGVGMKTREKLGKMAERIPVFGPRVGTTEQNLAKDRKAAIGRAEAEFVRNPDAVRRVSRHGNLEGTAAFYARAKAGDDKLTNEDYARYAPRALSMGFNKRDLERANPGMAYVLNNKRMDELRAANKTEAQARAQVTRDVVEKMTPAEIRKDTPVSAYTPAVLAAINPQQIEGIMGKGGTEKQKRALRDSISTPQRRAQTSAYGKQFDRGSLERNNLAHNIRQIRASGRTSQTQPQTQTGTRGGTPPPGGGIGGLGPREGSRIEPPQGGERYTIEGEAYDLDLHPDDYPLETPPPTPPATPPGPTGPTTPMSPPPPGGTGGGAAAPTFEDSLTEEDIAEIRREIKGGTSPTSRPTPQRRPPRTTPRRPTP